MTKRNEYEVIPVPEVVETDEHGWILWDLFNQLPALPAEKPAMVFEQTAPDWWADTEIMAYQPD